MQCWGEQQDALNLRRAKGKNWLNMIKIDRVTFSKNYHILCERKQKQSTKPNKFSRYTFVAAMKLPCLDSPSVLGLTSLLPSNTLSLSPSNLFLLNLCK